MIHAAQAQSLFFCHGISQTVSGFLPEAGIKFFRIQDESVHVKQYTADLMPVGCKIPCADQFNSTIQLTVKFMKQFKITVFHRFKRQLRKIGNLCDKWLFHQFFSHKMIKFIVQKGIIHEPDLIFFLLCNTAQVFTENGIQKAFFNGTVFGKVLFDRTGNVRQISFTCIMKQTGQSCPRAEISGQSFLAAFDAVLGYRMKYGEMAVRPGHKRKGMGNIFYENILRPGIKRGKMNLFICGNVIHLYNLNSLYHFNLAHFHGFQGILMAFGGDTGTAGSTDADNCLR